MKTATLKLRVFQASVGSDRTRSGPEDERSGPETVAGGGMVTPVSIRQTAGRVDTRLAFGDLNLINMSIA